MKIVGFAGSPREGNSFLLLQEALCTASGFGAETEIVHIGKMDIRPCSACDLCRPSGVCVTDDEFFFAEKKLREADAVIFASPVYFGGPTAQMKAFMDRTRPLRREHALRDKVAGAIAVGGSRNGGQETTIRAIHDFFLIHEMIVVGDETTAHYGGTGFSGNSPESGVDGCGVETARNLGAHVARVAKKTLSG